MLDITKDLYAHLVGAAKRVKKIERAKATQAQKMRGSLQIDLGVKPEPRTPIQTGMRISENPEVVALKKELENVENVFIRMKQKGEDLDVIMRIEKKIMQLKRLIDKKSYE